LEMKALQTPRVVVRGVGSFHAVARETRLLGHHCLLVVGEESMRRRGLVDQTVNALRAVNVRVSVFEGVAPEPSLKALDAVRSHRWSSGCDVVVGLGGGSVIDVAKGTALLAHEDAPSVDFFQGRQPSTRALPVLAAPSTFGTGAEATTFAVFADRVNKVKRSIRHPAMLPRVAILDPLLGHGAPPQITAASGLDALTQAIESYFSRAANARTRVTSEKAVRSLASGLPAVLCEPENLVARAACADGAFLAGAAFELAGLGIVHALANPLGGLLNVPHGELCGVLLPYGLQFNRHRCPVEYASLGEMLGDDPAAFCARLRTSSGLPRDLRHLPLSADDRSNLVRRILRSSTIAGNPPPVTDDDLSELLSEIFGPGKGHTRGPRDTPLPGDPLDV